MKLDKIFVRLIEDLESTVTKDHEPVNAHYAHYRQGCRGPISPPQSHSPLRQSHQRIAEAQFETFRQMVLEFDNWLIAHEKKESHRLELEFRLSKMKTLYAPYLKLLMGQADLRYFDLTKEFRDRYYEVIACAEIVLKSEPQNA